MRTTKVRTSKTIIYRECICGENAHHGKADQNSNGEWFYFFSCRNCARRIYEKRTAHLVEVA